MAEPKMIHGVNLCLEQDTIPKAQTTGLVVERQACWAMQAQFSKVYERKYVAILNGKVVDCDKDEYALARPLVSPVWIPAYLSATCNDSLTATYRRGSCRRTLRS